MKRDAATITKHSAEWQGSGEPWFEDYPLLDRALADVWWEDGKARTPYSMKLNVVPGSAQVIISDEEQRRSSYTTARTLQEAFGLIERMLDGGGLAWRSWGGKR